MDVNTILYDSQLYKKRKLLPFLTFRKEVKEFRHVTLKLCKSYDFIVVMLLKKSNTPYTRQTK